jgi:glycine/D-amino acid oxidase-like deaminating enzyme
MPVVDLVASAETPPRRVDVVIVGGGIIGVSAALFLAERKIATLLCEKGIIAGEQSGRNWGWCRTMGRDPRELPLAIESLKLWRRSAERGSLTRSSMASTRGSSAAKRSRSCCAERRRDGSALFTHRATASPSRN